MLQENFRASDFGAGAIGGTPRFAQQTRLHTNFHLTI